jgi:hypothetical protein
VSNLDVDDATIDLLLVEKLDGVLGIGGGLEIDETIAERARAAGDDVGLRYGTGGAEVLTERFGLGLEGQIANEHFGRHADDGWMGELEDWRSRSGEPTRG